jgi:hypothetical protein
MDRWVGGGLVAAALVLYLVVLPAQVTIPRIQVGGGMGGVAASPLFFPRLMALFLGLLGAVIFLRGQSRAETLADGEGFPFSRGPAVRVGGTVLLLVLYLALLEPVGYVLVTPVVAVALMTFLGFRRWGITVAVALLTTVLIYAGFRWGMKILLPEGLLD